MRGLSAVRRVSAVERVLVWGCDWDAAVGDREDAAVSGARDITPNVRWSLRGKMMIDSSNPGIGGSAFWRAVVNADTRS